MLGRALPQAAAGLDQQELTEVLLDSLRFTPYPGCGGGTRRAASPRPPRRGGLELGLLAGRVLAELGLGGLVDAVVTSAEVGARKPDPRIFEAALAAVRCPAARALFVGDSLGVDVAGGRAAGIRSVLLDRSGSARDAEDVERIVTLDNLPALLSGSPIV